MTPPRALVLYEKIVANVRAKIPALEAAGVSEAVLDSFLSRFRAVILNVIENELAKKHAAPIAMPTAPPTVPEHWTPSKRTAANLAALQVLSRLAPGKRPTPDQASALAQYSGWGGLSIKKVALKLPNNLPPPEDFGLIHEYYTPGKVYRAVAEALPGLRQHLGLTGPIKALEPSAGIGRALREFVDYPETIQWSAVEYSALSSRMLTALFPNAQVSHAPFERWVAENHTARFDLVVANPPYGVRNEAAAEDPEAHRYKTARAYLYFLMRTLDHLKAGGIGVYVIPTGFLGSKSAEFVNVRTSVFKRHHLLAAFRLPSKAPAGKNKQASVVYDQFPTDLLIFQARGGTLPEISAEDAPMVAGSYLERFPEHVLGEEVGKLTDGWDPSQPKSRRGYQVVGVFDGLPDFTPRPMVNASIARDEAPTVSSKGIRGGLARTIRRAKGKLAPEVSAAEGLGLRADAYLAAVAKQDPAAAAGWSELRGDLIAWRERYGAPQAHRGLAALVRKSITGIQRFLSLWTPAGLIEALNTEPVIETRYQGSWALPAAADWLYRQRAAQLTIENLRAFYREHRQPAPDADAIRRHLLPAGWFLDGEGWDELVPERDYLTGLLWPRYHRAKARPDDAIARGQLAQLRAVIGWRSGPDILKECLPIDTWLPLDVVTDFLNATVQSYNPIGALVREDGLVRPEGFAYADLVNTEKNRTRGLTRAFLSFIGWANLDKKLWNPVRGDVVDEESGEQRKEKKSEAATRENAELLEAWRQWFKDDPDRLDALEETYNLQMRGYVPPTFPGEPVPIARWTDEIRLHDYQNKAVRRLVENRSGILAFDTGLGKTYSGIATLALARQQGWAKRPVVVVPNSIAWKWFRDIKKCLPDYRVAVIGSNRVMGTRGKAKGRWVSKIDTPDERGQKWSQFQAGEFDVVLLTYSALSRTKIDPDFIEDYATQTIAIRRSIAMATDKDSKTISERREAEIKARAKKWLSEVMSPPRGWKYDTGIDWHQLGVDLLIVDEAQNFKNLFHSARVGEKADTKRAWALDFRCASVRKHSGGAGIILLSATPAKNDPVEFYNLLHYIHPEVWGQVAVDNHEAFLNRFGEYEKKTVPNASGTALEEKEVMVRFRNLDELRSVVYRWCEFKVASDVGLKIPDAVRHTHYSPLTAGQIAPIGEAVKEMVEVEESLDKMYKRGGINSKDEQTQKILQALKRKKQGLSLRIYLTSLHPDLPGIGDNAAKVEAADMDDAPKLKQCAAVIEQTSNMVCNADGNDCLDCGHIIFVENIAVHTWMKKILVAQGVPANRIAILNAREAKDTELRQQISEGFNGVGDAGDDDHEPPKYDIVIANAIAYEGMDLQRRTCAIHHLDVPWDPSTLQQRNGRGVRQGNKFSVVGIHYYFVQGSNELNRVERIERKRGWMASLVSSQARDTNTTLDEGEDDGAGGDIEAMAMRYVSPEIRAKMVAQRDARQLREATQRKERVWKQANKALRDIDDLFRRTDRESDPTLAGTLRSEADAELNALLKRIPASAFGGLPWHDYARRVRETSLFIPDTGLPLMPGDRIGLVTSVWDDEKVAYELVSLGKGGSEGKKAGAYFRRSGRIAAGDFTFLATKSDTREAPLGLPWEAEDAGALLASASTAYTNGIYDIDDWRIKYWHRLSPALQTLLWPAVSISLLKKGQPNFTGWISDAERLRTPIEVGGRLVLMRSGGMERMPEGAHLIGPTPDGWNRLLALAKVQGGTGEITWTNLDLTARFWWGGGRRFPRGFFKAAETPKS
ncbi:MAG: superfamily II DNA/RNA helicase [Myxococcota bacterium]|jgi:superfamily II DNA/RNA helicase